MFLQAPFSGLTQDIAFLHMERAFFCCTGCLAGINNQRVPCYITSLIAGQIQERISNINWKARNAEG